MQQLYAKWLARPLVTGHCTACGETCDGPFCTERCGQHFQALAQHHQRGVMALGVPPLAMPPVGGKRLLELDPENAAVWDALPDDLTVALLEVSFPRRETSLIHFDALKRFRAVSGRFAALIDAQIYPRMTRLPPEFELTLTDARLAPFVGLERLHLDSDKSTVSDLTRHTRLQRLSLKGDEHNIVLPMLVVLPRLVRLKLVGYGRSFGHSNRAKAAQTMQWLGAQLQSLTMVGGISAIVHTYVRNNGLAAFTALRRLRLARTLVMDDTHLAQLTALETLVLGTQPNEDNDRGTLHTDASLSALINLTALTLHSPRPGITAAGLSHLSQLRRLAFSHNDQIDDDALQHLGELRELRVQAGGHISDVGLAALPRLAVLEVREDNDFTSNGLARLTALTSLSTSSARLDDRALPPGNALRKLALRYDSYVSREGLRRCSALHSLDLYRAEGMSSSAFLDAHEWLPSLRWLRVKEGADDGRMHGHLRQDVVQDRAVLYEVRTDAGVVQRRLRDHLPVGCYVVVRFAPSYRVVERVNGAARVVEFDEDDDEEWPF